MEPSRYIRKFIEAQKKAKSGKADMAVSFIAKLYAIERQSLQSDAAAGIVSSKRETEPFWSNSVRGY
jgi:hypothetical protein